MLRICLGPERTLKDLLGLVYDTSSGSLLCLRHYKLPWARTALLVCLRILLVMQGNEWHFIALDGGPGYSRRGSALVWPACELLPGRHRFIEISLRHWKYESDAASLSAAADRCLRLVQHFCFVGSFVRHIDFLRAPCCEVWESAPPQSPPPPFPQSPLLNAHHMPIQAKFMHMF